MPPTVNRSHDILALGGSVGKRATLMSFELFSDMVTRINGSPNWTLASRALRHQYANNYRNLRCRREAERQQFASVELEEFLPPFFIDGDHKYEDELVKYLRAIRHGLSVRLVQRCHDTCGCNKVKINGS